MRILFLVLCIALSVASFSQQIKGKVVDASKAPLEYASVLLLNAKDSAMISYALTNDKGEFNIDGKNISKMILQVTFLGYNTHWQAIDISETKDMGNITLDVATNQLETIEVTGFMSPISFGKDTMQYNAGSFNVKPGDMVEDLLKKLPGMEVERDGTVKALGTNVENVLVNGKKFFGKDTRIGTKNIDADAVDKVQVFDRTSDRADFTGVDDGQRERTINLKLKKDRSAGVFGTMEGGFGTDSRFKGRANINKFSSKLRTSFIGMANNTNEQNFSMNEYIDFMGGIGALMGGGGRTNLNLSQGSGFGLGNNQGIQRSFGGGLNLDFELNDKTTVEASIFGNLFHNDLLSNTLRESLIPNSRFSTVNVTDQNTDNGMSNYNLRVNSKLDSTQNLTVESGGAISTNRFNALGSSQSLNANKTLINENNSERSTTGDSYNINAKLQYQKRLKKKGRNYSLSANINASNNDNDEDINALNTILSPFMSSNRLIQNQIGLNEGIFFNAIGNYMEPLSKKSYLEFNTTAANQSNYTSTDYFDIVNESPIKNTILSNLYQRDYRQYNNGVIYIFNPKIGNFNVGLKHKYSTLSGVVNADNNRIFQPFNAILPSAYARVELGTSENLNFNYNSDLVEPSLVQLQPIVNNSNPLSIYEGNPKLLAENTHRVNLSYTKYDAFNFRMYAFSLGYNYTDNKIVESLSLGSALQRRYKPINTEYDRTGTARFEFETPIKPLKIKTRSIVRGNFNQGFSIINDETNAVNRLGHGYTFTVENRNKDIVDLLVGYRRNRSDSRFANSDSQNQFYIESAIFSDLTISVKDKITIKSVLDYNTIKQSANLPTVNFPLWTMSATSFITKDRKLRATLSCFDLLNKNTGIINNISLNASNNIRSNVLNRYFLLSLAYNFKGFKKGGGVIIQGGGDR
jgi:hypothetical protein